VGIVTDPRLDDATVEAIARLLDDHAFDSDRWGCACGHKPDDSALNILRDQRRHVAELIIAAALPDPRPTEAEVRAWVNQRTSPPNQGPLMDVLYNLGCFRPEEDPRG